VLVTGEAKCWGDGQYGQLGSGYYDSSGQIYANTYVLASN
jgi:hypothetical protein